MSSDASHARVDVGGAAPYAIDIGPGLLGDGARLAAPLRGRHVLLATDANVAPLHADRVEAALRSARPGLDLAVAVGERQPEAAGQPLADRGLAGAHRADQHEVGCAIHGRMLRPKTHVCAGLTQGR